MKSLKTMRIAHPESDGEPMVDMINESARQTPVIAQTDVLVIGGGPAGLTAAIAAGG